MRGLVAVLAAAAAAAVLAPVQAQDLIGESSFLPPFEEFDVDGTRLVPGYRKGNDAEAKKTFVRLTPDRADKNGALWSRHAVKAEQWTAVMKFRISGQGKTMFGDGMALWYTTDTLHRPGRFHGHNEFFTGFGIVLDTFVNAENAHMHKDVSVVFGDSQGSPLAPHPGAAPLPGCDGDFRYSESRDDFAPTERFAAVKVIRTRDSLSVYLDNTGSGDFKTCVSGVMLPEHLRGGDWWQLAHLGVTASTGQLADNHDVLSLQVWTGVVDVDVFDEQSPLDVAADWATGDEKVDNAIRAAVSALQASTDARLAKLEHHMEHQLVAVQEGLQHTVDQLAKRERAAEKKLEELEQRLQRTVAKDVGSAFDASVKARLEVVEQSLTQKLGSAQDQILPTVDQRLAEVGGGSGWMVPLGVMGLLVLGVAGYAYRTQQMLRKSHLP